MSVLLTLKDQASGGLKSASGNVSQFSDTLKKMAVVAAAASAAAAVGVVTVAAKYESAFAGVRKTVDATEAEFERLSDGIRDMAKRMPIAATELAGVMEVAGQLGVRGVEPLKKFTETAAQLGVTTNLSAEEAATSLARMANVMGTSLTDVDRLGAAIVALGNSTATTEREILAFAERISGAGKIAGLAESDVLAIGAALSSVGVEAEAGGTSVQKVLLQMTQAVADGGKSLEVFAATSGLSSEQFSEAWRADPGQAFRSFVEGLGTQGDEAFKTLEALELGDQRLIRAFLSLGNAGDLLSRTLGTSSAAFRENSALTAEAEKRFATFQSQVTIGLNVLKDMGIEIGNQLLPALTALVHNFNQAAPSIQAFAQGLIAAGQVIISDIGPAFEAVRQMAGNVLAALQPVAKFLVDNWGPVLAGVAAATIFHVATMVPAFVAWATAAASAAIATIGAMLPVLAPIAAIGVGVGLLALAWQNNFMGIQEITRNVGAFIQKVLNGLGDVVAFFANGFIDVLNTLAGVSNAVLGTDLPDDIQHVSLKFGDMAANVLGAVGGMAQGVGDFLGDMKAELDKIGAAFTGPQDAAKKLAEHIALYGDEASENFANAADAANDSTNRQKQALSSLADAVETTISDAAATWAIYDQTQADSAQAAEDAAARRIAAARDAFAEELFIAKARNTIDVLPSDIRAGLGTDAFERIGAAQRLFEKDTGIGAGSLNPLQFLETETGQMLARAQMQRFAEQRIGELGLDTTMDQMRANIDALLATGQDATGAQEQLASVMEGFAFDFRELIGMQAAYLQARSAMGFGSGLSSFASGGVVPGLPGSPVPIIAHGGERFLGVGNRGGGRSMTVHQTITINGSVGIEDLQRVIKQTVRDAASEGGFDGVLVTA